MAGMMYTVAKSPRLLLLVGLVILVALVSASLSYRLMTSMTPRSSITRSAEGSAGVPSGAIPLPQTPEGVYILPTVDADEPLRLPSGTVGGSGACERLTNLNTCLRSQLSPLTSQITLPEASWGARMEHVCGATLNDLSHIRADSMAAGCIF